MNSKYIIVYLISNKNKYEKKKEYKNNLEKILYEEYEYYKDCLKPIINNIFDSNFKNTYPGLKEDVLYSLNKVINIDHSVHNINIEKILEERDISEIDLLENLSLKLRNILLDTSISDNVIIVLEYKLLKFIKLLIAKEKIYKNIYFVNDFNKPVYMMIKEFNSVTF